MINFQELYSAGFAETMLRFALCYLVNWIIVKYLYFKKSKRREYFFTFIIISIAIFFLVYLMMGMDRGKATMGVGLGLFGIFSIMRYRTDAMPVREMTYLFVIIALSLVNAISEGVPMFELGLTNIIFFLAVWFCEWRLKVLPSKIIQYDKIDLIKPECKKELIADLEQRLGLDIVQVEVGAVDFIRDMAMVKIRYRGKRSDGDVADNLKLSKDQLKTFNK